MQPSHRIYFSIKLLSRLPIEIRLLGDKVIFFNFTCAVPNQSLFVLHFDGWMVLDNRINSVTPRSIKPSIIIGNVRLSWGYDVTFFSYCNLLIDVYEVII